MKFTEEERKYIDEKLREADEVQKMNGNKTYTVEEAFGLIYKELGFESGEIAYIQD